MCALVPVRYMLSTAGPGAGQVVKQVTMQTVLSRNSEDRCLGQQQLSWSRQTVHVQQMQ